MAIRQLLQNHPRLSRGVLLALLILGCVANFFLFPKVTGTPYLSFYAKAGAVVSLGMLMLELAWKDINNNTGITSRDPLIYLGSTLQLIGLPLIALGVHLDRKFNSTRVSPLDLLFTLPFMLLMLFGIVIWFFCIAPAQYFVNYVCQAPSNLVNKSSARVYAQLRDGWQLEVRTSTAEDPVPKVPPDTSDTWWDASMQGQARKLTSAYSAIFLAALAWVLG
jgi:hypothetical protein